MLLAVGEAVVVGGEDDVPLPGTRVDQAVAEVFRHAQAVDDSQLADQPPVQVAAVGVALATDKLCRCGRDRIKKSVHRQAGGDETHTHAVGPDNRRRRRRGFDGGQNKHLWVVERERRPRETK